MNTTLLLILTVPLAFFPALTLQAQEQSLNIMSFNIRYDNPDDAPNHWDNRKDKVAELISFHEPLFVGTQEALVHQLNDLDQRLTEYDWIGRGRDDGRQEGEFSAIFFNTGKAELLAGSDSTIWLSETPQTPSKAWDAALPRVLTWGEFELKSSGDRIFVFNTHFDHRGENARRESAELILSVIEEVAGDAPVVLTGDFNITDDSKPYQILTSSFLQDVYTADEVHSVGPAYTFSGFEVSPEAAGDRIDYIFTNSAFIPESYATISSHRDGYYPSDHLPIIAKLKLREGQ